MKSPGESKLHAGIESKLHVLGRKNPCDLPSVTCDPLLLEWINTVRAYQGRAPVDTSQILTVYASDPVVEYPLGNGLRNIHFCQFQKTVIASPTVGYFDITIMDYFTSLPAIGGPPNGPYPEPHEHYILFAGYGNSGFLCNYVPTFSKYWPKGTYTLREVGAPGGLAATIPPTITIT